MMGICFQIIATATVVVVIILFETHGIKVMIETI